MNLKRKFLFFKRSETNILHFYLRRLYYKLKGKNIQAHQKVIIKGLYNIKTMGTLKIGVSDVQFTHKYDRTYLNIRGKLIINGNFTIGKGCRIDIGPNGKCLFGSGYITAFSKIIIHHGLKIGNNVAISWGCEFLDEDFHELLYEGKKKKDNKIEIGDNVWIGSGVKILKGVKIGDGNVIAANSVVTKSFPENNVLIGGNPAKIIKYNVKWGQMDKTFLIKKI